MSKNLQKSIGNTSESQWGPVEKFYFKCQSYCKGRGLPESVVDDFPAWATEKYLEGRRSQLNHLLVDYLRQFSGRRTNYRTGEQEKRYEIRKNLQFGGVQFDESLGTGGNFGSPEQIEALNRKLRSEDIAGRAARLRKAKFRVLFFCYLGASPTKRSRSAFQ